VLSAPTTKGFNRVAWIMPVVIFIAALTGVVLVVRAWKRRTPAPPSNPPGSIPEEMDEFRRRAREETSTL
jgi:cytochrome c-type biogenesis protein CcmH/NrfF